MAGRVAIVAGGTGALGRAVCLACLGAGAMVVATHRRAEEFEALAQAAPAPARARLRGAAVDLGDEAAVRELADGVLARDGRIDALAICAGGYAGGANLWETPPATLDRMLDLNLRPAFLIARAVLPAMLRQGSGAIVNVAARAGFGRAPGLAAYAAAKAAALALFDSLAEEVKGRGIRVNSVVPSIIDTPANRAAMPRADFAGWPKPEDIARVIVFLCSDEARLVGGAAVPVYGTS